MSKFNYTQRYISTSTISDTDALIFDVDGSDVPKRVVYSDLTDNIFDNKQILQLLGQLVEEQELTIKYLRKIASYE